MKYLKFLGRTLGWLLLSPLGIISGWVATPFFILMMLFEQTRMDWKIARTRTPDKFDVSSRHGHNIREIILDHDIDVRLTKKAIVKSKGKKLHVHTKTFASTYALSDELNMLRSLGLGRIYLRDCTMNPTDYGRKTSWEVSWAYHKDIGAKEAGTTSVCSRNYSYSYC